MSDPNQYTALICSLPYQQALFTEKQTAMSRFRLEQRLGQLDGDDAQVLRQIEDIVSWEHLAFEVDDADIVQRAKRVVEELPEGFLRDAALWRLEMRTIVAALRRRKSGEAAPAPHEVWGHGRWVDHIRRHWSEPDFRLSGVFPWVGEANRLLSAGDTVALQRLLLIEVWQHLGRMAWEHEFDFAAVVLYVLRWTEIDGWSRYDAERAAERFDELLIEGLGEYADLLPHATS